MRFVFPRSLPASALALASLAILALAFSPPAPESHRGLASGATVDDFCNQPFETVCQNQPTNADARNRQIAAPVDAAVAEAVKQALEWNVITPAQAKTLNGEAAFNKFVETLTNTSLKLQLEVAFYAGYYKKAGPRITRAEAVLEKRFQEIVDRVVEAVDADLASDEAKKIAHQNLAMIKLVTHANASEVLAEKSEQVAQYHSQFRNFCGRRVNRDNAGSWAWGHAEVKEWTATWVNTDRFILICPGVLLGATDDDLTSYEDSLLNSVFQIVAHEVGHHIDADDLPSDVFKLFFDCLKADRDYASDYSDAKRNEVTADYWASRALALHLAGYEDPSLTWDKNRVLRRSLGWLCGPAGAVATVNPAAAHPSGGWRISNLIRRDPWIHGQMECDTSYRPDSCTLLGGISRPDKSQ